MTVAATVGRGRGDERFEREHADEREAENEAAMRVRPDQHQQRETERRCFAALAGVQQDDQPRGEDRQREDVRAGQQRWEQAGDEHQQRGDTRTRA